MSKKQYTVREGKVFHAVVDGNRTTLYGGDKITLEDDQIQSMGDVFVQTDEDKTFYRADTPDGNPDTTAVVTQGNEAGDPVFGVTVPPAQAGQSAPVKADAEGSTDLEPVAAREQGGGNSPSSTSSSVQSPTEAAPVNEKPVAAGKEVATPAAPK